MAKEVTFPVGNLSLDAFVIGTVRKRFPKFKLYTKRSSALMWTMYICGFMWIWQRRFMDWVTTTMGTDAIYMGDKKLERKDWAAVMRTLRHEFIHQLQEEDEGIWFKLKYLSPQLWAVPALASLLAIWFSDWWLMSLVFAVFIAPWPSPWRVRFEMEGYTQTLLMHHKMFGKIDERLIKWVIDRFVTSGYWFMAWNRQKIAQQVHHIVGLIEAGKIDGEFLSYK